MTTYKNIKSLKDIIDEKKCRKIFIKNRWNKKVNCPFCGSKNVIRYGRLEVHFHRYLCKACTEQSKKKITFNDKTHTIFEGTKLSLSKWFLAGNLMKLGLSSKKIAEELGVEENTASRMCNLMRGSMFFQNCLNKLSGTVEIDEAYQTAGSKGNGRKTREDNKSRGIKKDLGRYPRKRGLKIKGRGSFQKDKPPVIGMIERGSNTLHMEVTMDVKKDTMKPIVERHIEKGSTVYTDEYSVYNFLENSGYKHESVNHSAKEYARGDVHINTQEGVWSLFRPVIGVARGVNKERLPLYVASFEFFRNVKKKGGDILKELIKVCSGSSSKDLLYLQRNSQPPILCPVISHTKS